MPGAFDHIEHYSGIEVGWNDLMALPNSGFDGKLAFEEGAMKLRETTRESDHQRVGHLIDELQ